MHDHKDKKRLGLAVFLPLLSGYQTSHQKSKTFKTTILQLELGSFVILSTSTPARLITVYINHFRLALDLIDTILGKSIVKQLSAALVA